MPISEEKRQELIERYMAKRSRVESYLAIIDEVIAGQPESIACQKYGIPVMSFRNYMRRLPDTVDENNNKTWAKLDYYCKEDVFIKDLLGEDGYAKEDFWEAYELVTTRALANERLKELCDYRYKDELSLEEIGEKVNLTRERVRQLINRALRIMRHPKYVRYFIYGINGAKQLDEKERLSGLEKQLEYEINNLETACLKLQARRDTQAKMLDILEKIQNQQDVDPSELAQLIKETAANSAKLPSPDTAHLAQMPIAELGFSIRTYNALRRAGYSNVQQLLAASEKDLMKIKGLGVTCKDEIIRTLTPYGYNPAGIASTQTEHPWCLLNEMEPDFNRDILVQTKKGYLMVVQLMYDATIEGDGLYFEDRFENAIEYDDVVAWMPLPRPYGV